MNLIQIKPHRKIIFFLLQASFIFCLSSNCQTNETQHTDPLKKYDELLQPKPANTQNTESPQPSQGVQIPQLPEQAPEQISDELTLLLPKLDQALHPGWNKTEELKIWNIKTDFPDFLNDIKDILLEQELEKILKQTYKKDEHIVEVLIYKFEDFTGAYSAYTVFHQGNPTKLKVGKNVSETEKSITFWKGNYFIDINSSSDLENITKEFIVLASQEISKNITEDHLPPIVSIQLPALNKVSGSERYCTGIICSKKFFLKDIDINSLKLNDSGGIVSAEYQFSDNPKEKEKITLYITRYITKEIAKLDFESLKQFYENKKVQNKEIETNFDEDKSIFTVKLKKDNYTMLKQRGNLLGIAFDIPNKKTGEQLLDLVPWPVEIMKPLSAN